MFIQGGRGRWGVISGDLKLTGAGDFWGGARGYQGALELTDDFGILIRVNSPAPVTLGI